MRSKLEKEFGVQSKGGHIWIPKKLQSKGTI